MRTPEDRKPLHSRARSRALLPYCDIVNMWIMRFIFPGLVLLWGGCAKEASPTQSMVVGTFQGKTGLLSETIVLANDGRFTHQVDVGGKPTLSETGTYIITKTGVELSPFTEFYDRLSRSVVQSGASYGSYEITFLSAPPFDMLKPAPEADYYLKKISSNPSE